MTQLPDPASHPWRPLLSRAPAADSTDHQQMQFLAQFYPRSWRSVHLMLYPAIMHIVHKPRMHSLDLM